MKVLTSIACGAFGALVVIGVTLLVFGPWWVPQEVPAPARVAAGGIVAGGRDVGGDVTFFPEPPPGYRHVWKATVVMNDAGDMLFVHFQTGELWQVAPPWCDVVVDSLYMSTNPGVWSME